MPILEDTPAWVRLARTPALDAATLAAALERLGSPRALIGASDAELADAGIGPAAREYLHAPRHAARSAELRWLEHARHHLVPCTAAEYPGMLRSRANRPLALYVAGRLDALNDPPLAVVGSRRPTSRRQGTAFEFSALLAERGLVIASGLAEGIDTAAHRGALAAQGLTLAVLGTGIDRIYPESNRGLERGHYVRRRPGEPLFPGHTTPARELSAAQSGASPPSASARSWSRPRAARAR